MYKEYEKVTCDEVYEYLRKSQSDDPLLSIEEVLKKHNLPDLDPDLLVDEKELEEELAKND
jgi:hypothetical protein